MNSQFIPKNKEDSMYYATERKSPRGLDPNFSFYNLKDEYKFDQEEPALYSVNPRQRTLAANYSQKVLSFVEDKKDRTRFIGNSQYKTHDQFIDDYKDSNEVIARGGTVSLTPIPIIARKKLKSNEESKDYYETQRSAVALRKMEYAKGTIRLGPAGADDAPLEKFIRKKIKKEVLTSFQDSKIVDLPVLSGVSFEKTSFVGGEVISSSIMNISPCIFEKSSFVGQDNKLTSESVNNLSITGIANQIKALEYVRRFWLKRVFRQMQLKRATNNILELFAKNKTKEVFNKLKLPYDSILSVYRKIISRQILERLRTVHILALKEPCIYLKDKPLTVKEKVLLPIIQRNYNKRTVFNAFLRLLHREDLAENLADLFSLTKKYLLLRKANAVPLLPSSESAPFYLSFLLQKLAQKRQFSVLLALKQNSAENHERKDLSDFLIQSRNKLFTDELKQVAESTGKRVAAIKLLETTSKTLILQAKANSFYKLVLEYVLSFNVSDRKKTIEKLTGSKFHGKMFEALKAAMQNRHITRDMLQYKANSYILDSEEDMPEMETISQYMKITEYIDQFIVAKEEPILRLITQGRLDILSDKPLTEQGNSQTDPLPNLTKSDKPLESQIIQEENSNAENTPIQSGRPVSKGRPVSSRREEESEDSEEDSDEINLINEIKKNRVTKGDMSMNMTNMTGNRKNKIEMFICTSDESSEENAYLNVAYVSKPAKKKEAKRVSTPVESSIKIIEAVKDSAPRYSVGNLEKDSPRSSGTQELNANYYRGSFRSQSRFKRAKNKAGKKTFRIRDLDDQEFAV